MRWAFVFVGLAERAAAADEIDDAIRAIDQSLSATGKAFREKKADEAAAALAKARATFDKLSKEDSSPAVRAKLEAIEERLNAADRAIAKLKAPPSATDATKKKSDEPTPAPTAKAKKPPKPRKPPKSAPVGPSFTSDVAPILNAKCGNCHIRGSRGGAEHGNFRCTAKGYSRRSGDSSW